MTANALFTRIHDTRLSPRTPLRGQLYRAVKTTDADTEAGMTANALFTRVRGTRLSPSSVVTTA
ncbi:MAG: hypothetical protein J6W23_07120 [Victivallales bacterium]|nr:hypothetical protein [Victivallales bacterium]